MAQALLARLQPADILIVEDDPLIAQNFARELERRGHSVRCAQSGREAQELADRSEPELVVLDLTLPDTHGVLTLIDLRRRTDASVVVCTGTARAWDEETTRALGAEDFIRKPVRGMDFVERVEAVLRRRVAGLERGPGEIRFGPLTLDQAQRQAGVGGVKLELTPKTYEVLAELVRRRGQAASRREISERVWQGHDRGFDRALDTHVYGLRRALRKAGADGELRIETVRRHGFMLVLGEGGDRVN